MTIRKRTWTWKGKTHRAWQLDWRTDGKRHQKQFRTRQEATLYRDTLIRQRYAQEYDVLLKASLGDFLKTYEAKKPWRTESYRERVMQALRQMPFEEFPTAEAIECYRDERLKDCAPATVRQDLAALSDCLKWAVRLKYLATNPCHGVERPSLPIKQDDPQPYLNREEFDQVSRVAGKDGPMWTFMAWTGLRITEVLALEWPDIREGYVVVRRGKGRKQRIVPLLDPAREALRRVPRHVSHPRIFWYAADRHACLRRFQRRCTRAGLKPYRLHDLRHTFGSWAAMAGVDLNVIAEAMGHASTTVTKLYAHLSPQYKRTELAKMARAVTRRQQERRKSSKTQAGRRAENPGVASSILALPTSPFL